MKFYCDDCDKVVHGEPDEVVDCQGCGMPTSEFVEPEIRFAVGVFAPTFTPAIPFEDTGSFTRPQALSIPGGKS